MNDQPTNDDQLLSAMGLSGLDEQRQQRVLAKLLRLLDFNVLHRLAETLSEEQMDQLSDLLSKEDVADAEISQWFAKNVPNYAQLVEEEAQKIKQQQDEVLNKVMGDQQ